MRVPSVLDPNRRLAEGNILWYLLAVALMTTALVLCFTACWQTDGFVQAIYENGAPARVETVRPANTLSIAPRTTSILWALLIYGALLARRYVRSFTNLPTFVLVALNIVFMASLIESFLPAQSVTLLKVFQWDALTLSPQALLICAVLLVWLGMRALSGIVFILLGIAFLSRAHDLNVNLGLYGSFYILSGFLSLLVQLRLPSMRPEGGLSLSLLQDFGGPLADLRASLEDKTDAAPQKDVQLKERTTK